jgi:hypothetical protein
MAVFEMAEPDVVPPGHGRFVSSGSASMLAVPTHLAVVSGMTSWVCLLHRIPSCVRRCEAREVSDAPLSSSLLTVLVEGLLFVVPHASGMGWMRDSVEEQCDDRGRYCPYVAGRVDDVFGSEYATVESASHDERFRAPVVTDPFAFNRNAGCLLPRDP